MPRSPVLGANTNLVEQRLKQWHGLGVAKINPTQKTQHDLSLFGSKSLCFFFLKLSLGMAQIF